MQEGRNALVVGGTGMLRAATLALAKEGWNIRALARDHQRLKALEGKSRLLRGRIRAVPVDYCKDLQLEEAVESACLSSGGFDLAICWIHQHSSAPRAPGIIARTISRHQKSFDYYDIIGSGTDSSDQSQIDIEKELKSVPGLVYHKIVLGSIGTGALHRWLTHEEICSGVLRALKTRDTFTLVGEFP